MIPEFKAKVGIKLSVEERALIEKLVSEGKYPSISALVRMALKEFLSQQN